MLARDYLVVILVELGQRPTLWFFERVQQLLDLCGYFPSAEMWKAYMKNTSIIIRVIKIIIRVIAITIGLS